ncbi:MAG: GUN4 domain-containing protein, partial [Elainellaceae cyanobacterium]
AIAAGPVGVTVLDSDRYGALAELLQTKQWQQADDETYRHLLAACARTDEEWLDQASIVEVCPRAALLAIDRLWQRHSSGRFGFSVQREIFLTAASQRSQPTQKLMAFGKEVDWLLWDNPLFGFKYYRQLTFTLDAPRGHLPAKWFWEIPWQQALKCGGLGIGRGGCAKDDGLLSALYDTLGDTQAVG